MNNHHALATLIQKIAQRLHDRYQDPILCEQYAWWTLEAITLLTRAQLLAQTDFVLAHEQELLIEQWLKSMVDEHMPIQYLIGWLPFLDLTITVKPPVLIPRPETEDWCARLIEQLTPCAHLPLRILDLCSGTGCIGLALAHALPHAQITAVDTALHALELGKLNAQTNHIRNITFICSDLFEDIPTGKFDLIVSNPPYISAHEFQELDTNVTVWEDKQALVADDNGYALIEKIIANAPAFIRPNNALENLAVPQLVIEHGHTQAQHIVDLMGNAGYIQVQAHKDLAGKDRVVTGRLPHVVKAKASE